ncbi:hypothetical protein APC1461_1451 [Bifidobacterium longum]|uniref:DUF559 domain-containing protein n=1 Tax=Bifidobacterium longum TaxID=216816 RepID=A0A2N0THQ5_BIFLN|nr:DUF559 domain-containing protein [Bifidobacterium longum]PKD14267.1 hypothetical protein APC1461_1451 [Bifidobacterium longum]
MSHFRIRHREGGIGHRHTFSLSRASLGVCCALIACCVVAETLLRRQSGHVLSYLLIPCLALVSLALLPCMPQSGAWLAVTLYCVGLVSPFPMSYSYKTRTRLALMFFGLPIPQTQYGITDSENGYTYTVDMAYPQYKVAIEYDGDHHRRFRKQYVRDQQKRRRLRQLGWTVIEVFADDLWNTAKQRAFAQEVATAMQIPLPGRPQPSCRVLIDGSLTINARKGEYRRRKQAKHNKASQH